MLCCCCCCPARNAPEDEKLSEEDERADLRPKSSRVSRRNTSWWAEVTGLVAQPRAANLDMGEADKGQYSSPRRREPSCDAPVDPRHMTSGQLRRLLSERGFSGVGDASRSRLLDLVAESDV